MSTEEKLPLDLAWRPDGHVTEVALSVIADGEHSLLPEGAMEHVARCEACSAELGASALMSLRVTEELPAIAARHALVEVRAEAEARTIVPARASSLAHVALPIAQPTARPLPVRAIAAALLIAAIGALPSLVMGLPALPDLVIRFVKMLPVIGRSAVLLLQSGVRGSLAVAPLLSWMSAGLFLITGLAFARAMSRGRSLQGGVR